LKLKVRVGKRERRGRKRGESKREREQIDECFKRPTDFEASW